MTEQPPCSCVFFLCLDKFLSCEIGGSVLETFQVSTPSKLADASVLKGKSRKGEQLFPNTFKFWIKKCVVKLSKVSGSHVLISDFDCWPM